MKEVVPGGANSVEPLPTDSTMDEIYELYRKAQNTGEEGRYAFLS